MPIHRHNSHRWWGYCLYSEDNWLMKKVYWQRNFLTNKVDGNWLMNKVDLNRMLVCTDTHCYCTWKNIRVKNKKISPSLCQWFREENAALAQCTMVWWVEEYYFKTLVICCVLCLWFIAPNLEYHHPLNVIELLQKYAKIIIQIFV